MAGFDIGGFWITAAANSAAALDWAREATAACRAAVEVWPFAEQPPDFANSMSRSDRGGWLRHGH